MGILEEVSLALESVSRGPDLPVASRRCGGILQSGHEVLIHSCLVIPSMRFPLNVIPLSAEGHHHVLERVPKRFVAKAV